MGSRLLIPCSFNTDTTTYNGKIEMEWVRSPFTGGSVKSLIYVYNAELLESFDSRAHVFLNNLRHGNCSLAIDPVRQEDDGYFELHLKVDGNSYEPFPFLSVRVFEDNGKSCKTCFFLYMLLCPQLYVWYTSLAHFCLLLPCC